MSLEVIHTLYGGETVVLEMVKAVGKVMEEKKGGAFEDVDEGCYFIVFVSDGLKFRCKASNENERRALEENRHQLVKKLEAYWRKTQ